MRKFAALSALLCAVGFMAGCCGDPCSPCCPEPVYQSPCCPAPSGSISAAPWGGGGGNATWSGATGGGSSAACGADGKSCGGK
jgi:hypothetical protein